MGAFRPVWLVFDLRRSLTASALVQRERLDCRGTSATLRSTGLEVCTTRRSRRLLGSASSTVRSSRKSLSRWLAKG